MSKKLLKLVLICLTTLTVNTKAKEEKSKFKISADLVSRYIWRGKQFSASPAIQPTIEGSFGNLSIGAWGSYTTDKFNTQEADLYIGYNINEILSFTLTDYYFPSYGDEFESSNYNYFNYKKNEGHIFEFSSTITPIKDLGLSLMGAVNFYGDDENSIYLELSYSHKNITIFTGGTPDKGAYGTGAGIINLGATATKELKLSSTYSLPIAVSLITNPREEKIFMVFSLSF